ncbi:cytochrome bc1 complex Rieske iron-sulfur subunit [Nostocoides jenkinsii]|uniref:Cytochrome bc1 complex Rieske iron-sulfur subunit n=1 Tax=Nostocoides jenkinsii Ben 74 TaxID=1193518 RepID=A0A077MAN5_9MICO|nr:Rieske 2Fe-2S domain-containing protein [Tetrasphaera jenkinsii]CCI52880.1 Ubiquinol-cytochrome c reductase iron-sulfur subunit [Tetrasphaera jenkinsii Ben 74]
MTTHEFPDADSAGVVRLDEGHHPGDGKMPAEFENPGLPPHVHRMADHDEAGAKRAERQVAGLFGLSMLGTIVAMVGYFAFSTEHRSWVPGLGHVSTTNLLLGIGIGLGLLGIGLGAVHWAKTLMPDEEVVEMRHPMRSSDEARAGFAEVMRDGGEKSQLFRRPLLKLSLGGAMGLFSLPLLVQLLGSLGPLPRNNLDVTFWDGHPHEGEDGKQHRTFEHPRLVTDPEGIPIKAADVTIGSVYHVLPAGLLPNADGEGGLEHGQLEEKAKAAVLLMRLDPTEFQDTPGGKKAKEWGHDGIVAYSKICTHVGCPVGLYERTTHHLLCPCHQSTFDVTDDCKVIFGPAKRPLPQLKITVDDEGYLIAAQPFQEAVGPSFWERG